MAGLSEKPAQHHQAHGKYTGTRQGNSTARRGPMSIRGEFTRGVSPHPKGKNLVSSHPPTNQPCKGGTGMWHSRPGCVSPAIPAPPCTQKGNPVSPYAHPPSGPKGHPRQTTFRPERPAAPDHLLARKATRASPSSGPKGHPRQPTFHPERPPAPAHFSPRTATRVRPPSGPKGHPRQTNFRPKGPPAPAHLPARRASAAFSPG